MSTYNSPTDLSPLTKARSVDINDFDAAVAAAFALLPDEADINENRINYGIDSGSANNYSVMLPYTPPGLVDGMRVRFSPTATNTGDSTLNIGLGAMAIKLRDGSETRPGDIQRGVPLEAAYSSLTGFWHIDGNASLASVSTLTPPVEDGLPLLKNTADPTKMLQFVLNAIATDTTRIATVPDKDFTLGKDIGYIARNLASNTALTIGNQANWIDYTSGTFTQAFNACATLKNGWWVVLRNAGTGNITLDPNGAETIDGRTSFIMYPGETRFVQCDGTALRSYVISPYLAMSSVAGSFIKPPGYKKHRVTLDGAASGGQGGGGGGSGNGTAGNAGGGGGGGGASGNPGRRVTKEYLDADLPNSVAFAVGSGGVGGVGGAGGAGVASTTGNPGIAGSAGSVGGASTFGSVSDAWYLSAAGGPVAATNATGGGGGNIGTTSPGNGGSDATAAAVLAMTFDQKLSVPSTSANSGANGASGTSAVGGAGGNGAVSAASSLSPSPTTAAASGGAAQTNLATAGNPGANGADGLPAQGGSGGGGGGGSRCQPNSLAGGNGGDGGKGGDGQFMAEGVL